MNQTIHYMQLSTTVSFVYVKRKKQQRDEKFVRDNI